MKKCPKCKKSVAKWLKTKLHGYCHKCANHNKREYVKRKSKLNPTYYSKKYKNDPATKDSRKFRVRHIQNKFREFGNKVDRFYIDDWMQQFFGPCVYCGKEMDFKDMSLDHILPTSRGGTNDESNLQLVHKICNQMKGMLTHEEFLTLLEFCKKHKDLGEIVLLRLKQSSFVYRRGGK